jgi:hypothetical protein
MHTATDTIVPLKPTKGDQFTIIYPTSNGSFYSLLNLLHKLCPGFIGSKNVVFHLVIVVVGTIQLSSVFVALSINVAFTPAVTPAIPPNMHKCIDLVATTYSLGIGLNATMGQNGNVSKTLDNEVKTIEGCILHPERLFK